MTVSSRHHGCRTMSLGSSYKHPGASASCLQSPSGLTSSDESESDGESPSFSFLAPTGYTGIARRHTILPLHGTLCFAAPRIL